MSRANRTDHIRLTSHPAPGSTSRASRSHWGAADGARARARSSARCRGRRTATSSAAMAAPTRSIARSRCPPARSIRSGAPTSPTPSRPRPSARSSNGAIPPRSSSLDPWGHHGRRRNSASEIAEGIDIRPSIAVTRARLDLPEIAARRSPPGGSPTTATVVQPTAACRWSRSPSIRSGICPASPSASATTETSLRRTLFEQTAGMFPELVTRPDLQVFLPPIGGTTVYLFGDVAKLADPRTPITCRVHDECNGSDVFGSDICTCRPYLVHGIEECARAAQAGGLGIIVYNRKEGRALGEVTKFLVYNARKRQEGGDAAAAYFERTECVAGVQDARFQQLMPDVIHWLGIDAHRPLRLHERHETRRAASPGHRDRRARADPATSWFRPTPMWRSRPRRPPAITRRHRARAAGPRRRGRPLAGQVLIDAMARRLGTAGAALAARAQQAVRARAQRDARRSGLSGGLTHFTIDLDASDGVADARARGRRARPIPRSKCRSMRAGGISCVGGVDRWAALDGRDVMARSRRRGRARPSTSPSSACCSTPAPGRVALSRRRDAARASADPRAWRSRASTCSRAALSPAMPRAPLRADADVLQRNCRCRARAGTFRSSDANPLLGLEGRADLLRRLGQAVAAARGSVRARTIRRGRAGCSIISRRRPRAARSPAPAILVGGAAPARTDLAVAAGAWRRFRSAIAGAIRRSRPTTRPTGSCRCTSCRNG